ncbi:YjfI family protein [Pseudomaricurvus alkylphenolicus]|uniref:biofilm formation regulator BacA n=1 Tax=Pseudomaricurvus alkylphenolicus TaxID=1306991 RepID=UPI00142347B6|nr:YjfI family protein [Pseudomaricurvus alkylphenolicus]NIB39106.1 YjfI family protein [Pseudomaricurvus alkylphenolicus]
MKAKSSAHYQREYRRRLREQGLVKKEVWILPDNAKHLAEMEKQLRLPAGDINATGVIAMTEPMNAWTTNSLFAALKDVELFTSGQASVELIDGIEPALHVVMKEFGDLPIFLTVAGEQIIAEAVLWSVDEVTDQAGFNEAVLRTHKYFPLSTISLDTLGADGDYYHMFGALSSTSILANVVFEIEVLANNVIQATEAYSEFLAIPVAAS